VKGVKLDVVQGAKTNLEPTVELLILAVDDTVGNLVALERVLSGVGARIVRASSGAEALGLCLRHNFALAILDVQMPEMDGYELAEILLADPATCRTPIIFMTAAYFDESHVFRGYTTGAVDYIIKPYHPQTLLAKVRVFMELAVQRQQLERLVAERNRALDASEGRFDDLFELAPQALLMISLNGAIQRSNAAAETVFGYGRGGLQGLRLPTLLPKYPIPRSIPVGAVVDGSWSNETWSAARPDGSLLQVEVRAALAEIAGEECVLVSVSDVSERVSAFESLQRSLREKEVLLKEVHHRVKNNLQVVSSLLGLQSAQSSAPEVQSVIDDCVGRVRSMAIVHEQLYGSDSLSQIDLGHYAQSLGNILRGTYAPEARLLVVAEPVNVSIEIATPLGLLLNELITNALKHGLALSQPDRPRRTGEQCDVLVEIASDAAHTYISVTDSGRGLTDSKPKPGSNSIGMELIRALSRQVGAQLEFDSHLGLKVKLTLTRL
jgi:PAS domain S-box-containing protein